MMAIKAFKNANYELIYNQLPPNNGCHLRRKCWLQVFAMGILEGLKEEGVLSLQQKW